MALASAVGHGSSAINVPCWWSYWKWPPAFARARRRADYFFTAEDISCLQYLAAMVVGLVQLKVESYIVDPDGCHVQGDDEDAFRLPEQRLQAFFLIGLVQVSLITVFGTLWFDIPFKGNPLVLLLGTCLFLLTALAIGLLISTLCKTQQQAFASNFFVLNPMFILSGFSFPISSMPQVLQWLTYLDPLRYSW